MGKWQRETPRCVDDGPSPKCSSDTQTLPTNFEIPDSTTDECAYGYGGLQIRTVNTHGADCTTYVTPRLPMRTAQPTIFSRRWQSVVVDPGGKQAKRRTGKRENRGGLIDFKVPEAEKRQFVDGPGISKQELVRHCRAALTFSRQRRSLQEVRHGERRLAFKVEG